MDQNQTYDSDLQRAIDSITDGINVDPVFSDPVAAPSSIPEGDTGELGEPIGPFMDSTSGAPDVGVSMDAFSPSLVPTHDFSGEVPVPPMPEEFQPFPAASESAPNVASKTAPSVTAPIPEPESKPKPEPAVSPKPELASVPSNANLNMHQVKEAALRDLVPLLGRLNMTPSQRFEICRSIFEDLRDYSVLEQAYRAAVEIPNETKRAEALLYLVETINKM